MKFEISNLHTCLHTTLSKVMVLTACIFFNRLGILRDKLSLQGLKNIHYIIVNEKTLESRAMYWKLKLKTPKNITVYQQSAFQPDVWRILRGNKDDFLIYDRFVFLVVALNRTLLLSRFIDLFKYLCILVKYC